MPGTAKSVIERRKKEAERQLIADLERDASTDVLAESQSRLAALNDIGDMLPVASSPKWVLPASVAMIGASLIGMGSLVHLNQPQIRLDAKVQALTVEASADGIGLTNAGTVTVTNFDVVGLEEFDRSILAGVIGFSSLELIPGARAEVSLIQPNCVVIQMATLHSSIAPSQGGALRLTLHRPGPSGTGTQTIPIAVPQGGAVSFCAAQVGDHLLLGRVATLDLSRIHLRDLSTAETIRASSIVSGSYAIPAVNRAVTLGGHDRISLELISDGWVVIGRTDALTISFSGRVGNARSYGLSQAVSESLTPTVLEWFSRSPWVTSLFGLFTGLVGIAWSAIRYFR